MAEICNGRKIIAVSNSAERETYLLKKIIRDSGRSSVFAVVPADEAMHRGLKATVLLAQEPPEAAEPESLPVFVTKFRPKQEKPAGFRNVVTYSTEWDGADFTARNVRALPDGVTAFEIVGVGIIGRVRLAQGCSGDVEAALAAAAAATASGIPFAEALSALNEPEKT